MPVVLFTSLAAPQQLADLGLAIFCRSFRAREHVTAHRVGFVPTTRALDPNASRETLSSGVALEDIPPGSERENSLVLNLGGEYYTVDVLSVEGYQVEADEVIVQLGYTRVESMDGDPALVDVFIIVPLTDELLSAGRLRFSFLPRQRSFDGVETPLAGGIAECSVPLRAERLG